MSAIRTDDHEISLLLDRLVRLVNEHGGKLHADIEMVCEQGELSIHSRLGDDNHDEIIFGPEACLPCPDDFIFSLDGDTLIATPRPRAKAGAAQVAVMALMLELYNRTGKIHSHRQASPILALSNAPTILSHLYHGGQCRPDSDFGGDGDKEIIDSFIASRRFNYFADGVTRKVLMPIIDFLNHNYSSSDFRQVGQQAAQTRGLSVLNSTPLPGSSECFVRYNTDGDALGMYIKYGFVDVNATFLRSIPMYIDLYGVGRIKVNRFVLQMIPDDRLPLEARDLQAYFPHTGRLNATTLEVSQLIIPPPEDSLSLRRILAVLIRVLSPSIDDNTLKTLVHQAETQLLIKNRNYYVELEQLLSLESESALAPATVDVLHLLGRTQMDRLNRYQEQCPD